LKRERWPLRGGVPLLNAGKGEGGREGREGGGVGVGEGEGEEGIKMMSDGGEREVSLMVSATRAVLREVDSHSGEEGVESWVLPDMIGGRPYSVRTSL